MSATLAKLERARTDLAEARTLPEVKQIHDIAEGARTYAKAAKLGRESQNYAAEIALLASRKAGELLKQLQKSKGGEHTHRTAASVAGVSEYRKALKDTDTPERTAQHWQKLSGVPEADVQKYVATVRKKHSGEITAAGLMREVKKNARRTRPTTIVVGSAKPCGRKLGSFDCCSVVQGDCRELLPQLPTGTIEAIVCDPPYGVDAAAWDGRVPYEMVSDFLRVASGTVVWFGGGKNMNADIRAFNPVPERTLIWYPPFIQRSASSNRIFYKFHPIYCWRLPNQHDGPGRDVLDTKTEGAHWWNHHCSKPVALMRLLVGFAPADGIVLDPFAGSGSTLVAAQSTGRHFLGFEKDAKYVEVCNARLSGVIPRDGEAVEKAA